MSFVTNFTKLLSYEAHILWEFCSEVEMKFAYEKQNGLLKQTSAYYREKSEW